MTDGHGAGHGGVDVGAVSQGNIERDIARTMTARTLALGKARGGSLVSLTVDKGYPYNINEPVALANRYGVRYAFQHHVNAGGGTGVEVWYYQGDAVGRALAAKISAAIAKAYGIPDRGAKATTYFGFICNTNMTAFIIEWGFVDAPNNVDCSRILADPDKGVNAMLTAIGFKEAAVSFTTYHCIKEGTQVMDGQGTAAKSIKTLRYGEELQCKPAKSTNWYEVQSPKGWIRRSAMKQGNVPLRLRPWYNPGVMEVYEKKSTDSTLIRTFQIPATIYRVCSYNGGWYQVMWWEGTVKKFGYTKSVPA